MPRSSGSTPLRSSPFLYFFKKNILMHQHTHTHTAPLMTGVGGKQEKKKTFIKIAQLHIGSGIFFFLLSHELCRAVAAEGVHTATIIDLRNLLRKNKKKPKKKKIKIPPPHQTTKREEAGRLASEGGNGRIKKNLRMNAQISSGAEAHREHLRRIQP